MNNNYVNNNLNKKNIIILPIKNRLILIAVIFCILTCFIIMIMKNSQSTHRTFSEVDKLFHQELYLSQIISDKLTENAIQSVNTFSQNEKINTNIDKMLVYVNFISAIPDQENLLKNNSLEIPLKLNNNILKINRIIKKKSWFKKHYEILLTCHEIQMNLEDIKTVNNNAEIKKLNLKNIESWKKIKSIHMESYKNFVEIEKNFYIQKRKQSIIGFFTLAVLFILSFIIAFVGFFNKVIIRIKKIFTNIKKTASISKNNTISIIETLEKNTSIILNLINKLKTIEQNITGGTNKIEDIQKNTSIQTDVINDILEYTNGILTNTDSLKEMISKHSNNIEEMNAFVSNMNSSIKEINTKVNNTSYSMENLIETAKINQNTMGNLSDKMHKLIESIDILKNFVLIITEIAEKTKLLSINAAIEAARQEKQGKGFIIITEEIRKLSSRVNKQSGEAKLSIEKIEKSINETADELNKSVNNFNILLEETRQVNKFVYDVKQVTEKQTADTNKLSDKIIETSKITKDVENKYSDINESISGITNQVSVLSISSIETESLVDSIKNISKEIEKGLSELSQSSNFIDDSHNSILDLINKNNELFKLIENNS